MRLKCVTSHARMTDGTSSVLIERISLDEQENVFRQDTVKSHRVL